jgi:hypothetical protein
MLECDAERHAVSTEERDGVLRRAGRDRAELCRSGEQRAGLRGVQALDLRERRSRAGERGEVLCEIDRLATEQLVRACATAPNAAVSSPSPARIAIASPNAMWTVGRPRRSSSSSIAGRSSCTSV